MNSDEFLGILRTRRSVRKFLSMPVPHEDIEKILTAASWAPSGTNHQNWHFIVIQTKEVKDTMIGVVHKEVEELAAQIAFPQAQKRFLAYTNYFTFFHTAPVVVAVVQKPYDSVTDRIFERSKLPNPFKSTTGIQGPSAAIQNLLLMAHALGYGTCWMTGPLIAKDKLESILNIKEPDHLMALIPLGKPAHSPVTPPHRKKIMDITEYL